MRIAFELQPHLVIVGFSLANFAGGYFLYKYANAVVASYIAALAGLGFLAIESMMWGWIGIVLGVMIVAGGLVILNRSDFARSSKKTR